MGIMNFLKHIFESFSSKEKEKHETSTTESEPKEERIISYERLDASELTGPKWKIERNWIEPETLEFKKVQIDWIGLVNDKVWMGRPDFVSMIFDIKSMPKFLETLESFASVGLGELDNLWGDTTKFKIGNDSFVLTRKKRHLSKIARRPLPLDINVYNERPFIFSYINESGEKAQVEFEDGVWTFDYIGSEYDNLKKFIPVFKEVMSYARAQGLLEEEKE